VCKSLGDRYQCDRRGRQAFDEFRDGIEDASKFVRTPRHNRRPPVDVFEDDRHDVAVVVRPQKAWGRDRGGKRGGDPRLAPVHCRRVWVGYAADRLDEHAPAVGQAESGSDPG
jgi:hypothetical protein